MPAADVVNYTVAELLERWHRVHEPRRYMFTVARRFIWRAAREAGRFTGAPPSRTAPPTTLTISTRWIPSA